MVIDDFFPYRLNRIAELVSQRVMPVYRERYGMTRPQWRVLAHLGSCKLATAKELGDRTAMHKTKISRALQDLEDRKWIRRTKNEPDRRFNQVEITKEGTKAFETLHPEMQQRADDILLRLSPGERDTVEQAITILTDAFSKDQ